MDLMNQMLKMPFQSAVASLEAMCGVARGMEKVLNSAVDLATISVGLGGSTPPGRPTFPGGPAPSGFAPPPGFAGAGSPPPLPAPAAFQVPGGTRPPHCEEKNMADCNMNDDMVKYVRVTFFYTEPDCEFQVGRTEDLVNYATDINLYAGQKMTEFVLGAFDNPINPDPKVQRLVSCLKKKPSNRRYLRPVAEVLSRFSKEESYYERRQTRGIERIATALGGSNNDNCCDEG